MIWMLAGMAALSAVKTGIDNKEKAKQIKAMNKVKYAADLETLANNAQNVSSLMVQQGQMRVQAAKEFNAAEAEAFKAKGTGQAQAAAAQVKGASVDATLNDIDRELYEAKVSTVQNFEAQEQDLGNRLQGLIAGAKSSLNGWMDPNTGRQNPLLNGLMTAGSAYMTSAFQFGASRA
jgi:hypothetical protein